MPKRILQPALCLRHLSRPVCWGLALLMVVASCALRILLFGTTPGFPYLFFFPAIIAASVLFDRGSGYAATVASSILAVWLFVPPAHSFAIARSDDAVATAFFVGIALFLSWLIHLLHKAFNDSQQAWEVAEAARARAEQERQQRDLLLTELGHRVKNDLQRLAALLRMQAREGPPEAAAALYGAIDRLRVVARVHERLQGGEAFLAVDSGRFFQELVADLGETLAGLRPIGLFVEAEAHRLPLSQVSGAGLVANELITNALKHAFPGNRSGTIRVTFRREKEDYVLCVSDDGSGMAGATPSAAGPHASGGLGQQLVRGLAAQIGGRIEIQAVPGAGTSAVLRFPALPVAEDHGKPLERAA